MLSVIVLAATPLPTTIAIAIPPAQEVNAVIGDRITPSPGASSAPDVSPNTEPDPGSPEAARRFYSRIWFPALMQAGVLLTTSGLIGVSRRFSECFRSALLAAAGACLLLAGFAMLFSGAFL